MLSKNVGNRSMGGHSGSGYITSSGVLATSSNVSKWRTMQGDVNDVLGCDC